MYPTFDDVHPEDEKVLQWGPLTAWLDEHGIGTGDITHVARLAGGTQNVMISFTRAGENYVLRRGPQHLRAGSNTSIRREIQLLKALAKTDVPHARLVAASPSTDVLGDSAFYVMERIDGVNAAEAITPFHRSNSRVRHAMTFSMVDALSELGSVDHEAIGLGDFGKPADFLARQGPRWLTELERTAQAPGFDGVVPDDVMPLAEFLSLSVPTDYLPGIVHGDFHVANVMFAPDSADVAAVIDWEMATIGDPRLDLGVLLALWPATSGAPDLLGSAFSLAGGLPSASEVARRYAERSPRSAASLDWFYVLGCFKLAIVLESTYARSLSGQAPSEVGDRLHRMALALLERACLRADLAPLGGTSPVNP